jgi:hypothetical protein
VNRLSTILILLLITLAACVTSKAEFSTQIPATETQTLYQPAVKMLSIGDGGLISDQPCASPCFYGIRIGETPFNQVITILKNNGIFPCYKYTETTIMCGINAIDISVGANATTFIVDGIGYYPSTPITLDEIIEKYGDPSLVQIQLEPSEETFVSMLLLWDLIKMRIDMPETPDIGEQSYIIEKKAEVKEVIFLNETSYGNLIASGFSQPWKGYGTYKP